MVEEAVDAVAAALPHRHRLAEDREAPAPPPLDHHLLGAHRPHRKLVARLEQGVALQEDMVVAHTTEEVQQRRTDQEPTLVGM